MSSTMYAGEHAGFSPDTVRARPTRPESARQRQVRSSEPLSSGRLTRRGRLVVLLTLVALALVVFTFVGSPAASTAGSNHPTTATVVVQPGQTLWDIATEVAPGTDPRDAVAWILELNNLNDPGAIRPGQPLYVPIG